MEPNVLSKLIDSMPARFVSVVQYKNFRIRRNTVVNNERADVFCTKNQLDLLKIFYHTFLMGLILYFVFNYVILIMKCL